MTYETATKHIDRYNAATIANLRKMRSTYAEHITQIYAACDGKLGARDVKRLQKYVEDRLISWPFQDVK